MHLFLLLALMFQPAKTQSRAYKVTSVPPIIVSMSQVRDGHAYVEDVDGTIRTCPDAVGVYVRVETEHSDQAFHYLMPPTMIIERTDRRYTIACFKVE